MHINYVKLKEFRDLKIRKSEICDLDKIDIFNAIIDKGKPVIIHPYNIIKLLNEFRENKLSEEHLLEWVNTIMFTDLFRYNDKFRDSIASVISELEEIDEEGKELTYDKIKKYIYALENNIEI
ncbi:hypothetical protein RBH29_17585 [Herbivorax sp. ANBcel31]|uniref:hypothetical protein n=1 Tax=Herbivorax sp. ANBcel31 TaxID=3069754 RepID=UPI0027ADDF34|nr:hypothetical protein [Herbivorax sp. ANBcel31]MDQ2088239.1 hypothetical protein [Herbivorax sp. ANBcel31]